MHAFLPYQMFAPERELGPGEGARLGERNRNRVCFLILIIHQALGQTHYIALQSMIMVTDTIDSP